MITVNYSHSRPYNGNRPYADVTLVAKSGYQNVSFKALVDTGADHLQIPLSAASSAGLNISTGTPITVRGVAGKAAMYLLSAVSVEVEGKRVTVEVLLDPSGSSSALLGREALLAAAEAGFNASEWLWEL